jgi:hypothetical protein
MSEAVKFSDMMKKLGPNTGTGGSEPLPVGEYSLAITECAAKVTQTGKPMLSLKATVVGGPYSNRPVWDNLVVSADNDTAMRIFFGKMGALGLGDYVTQDPSMDQLAEAMIGRRFVGKLGTSEYRGRTRNEITGYKPFVASTAPVSDVPAVTDTETFPMAQPVAAGAAVPPPPAAPPAPSVPPAPAF